MSDTTLSDLHGRCDTGFKGAEDESEDNKTSKTGERGENQTRSAPSDETADNPEVDLESDKSVDRH